jgi:hypothetical protein
MSIIVGGTKHEIPLLEKVICWADDTTDKIEYITDKSERKHWIQGVVAHTTKGKLGTVLPGIGQNSGQAEKLARYQTNTERQVSWDFTEEQDGSWYVQNDVLKHYSWQAGDVNGITCGFEMVQSEDGSVYEIQIKNAVLFLDFITARLGIQRQIPWDKVRNKPVGKTIKRISGDGNARDVVGIYGHRNQTDNRGLGDPGDHLFYALRDAGYELFDLDSQEDLNTWKQRQLNILKFNASDCDGVCGPKTVQALKQAGYAHGLWVRRPMDNLLTF